MIKGCQREMIVLQTQESALFESAYFILRRQKIPPSKNDMISEANRIIGAGSGYLQGKRGRHRRMLWFMLGFLSGGAGFFLIRLLIGLFT